MTPGQRLRAVRKANSISLRKFEKLTGISRGSLSLVERDKVNLGINRAARISKGLNIKLCYLLFGCCEEQNFRRGHHRDCKGGPCKGKCWEWFKD